MARVLVLLLCVSMCLLKNGCSLIWEENLKAQYVNCTGENVVFPWRYTLEKGDNLIAISWSHRVPGAQKETTFGTYGLGAFDSADERISQVDTAGIKVSNVSRSDSGTYIVNVRLSGGVASQTTSLLVAEPPQTKTGKLEAFVNNVTASVTTQTSSSSSSSSSASNHRLMCGNFIHLGTPPSTVVWKDPDGSLLPSTSYDAGYFILELPRESMGGQYQCLLNANSTAVGCLPPDAHLHRGGDVLVIKPPSQSLEATTSQSKVSNPSQTKGASIGGGLIAAIVIVLVVLIAVVIVVLVFIVLRRRKGKSYAPKEPDSPVPQDEAKEPFNMM